MATNATGMSAAEKQAVAAFLSATAAPTAAADPATGACPPSTTPLPDPATLPMWNGWGNDGANTRFQNAKAAGLTAADVPKLTLKWAFGYANSNAASGQPTVAAGRVFVGNTNGMVVQPRSADRLHLLDVQGRQRRPHGDERCPAPGQRRDQDAGDVRRRLAPTPTPSTRRPGRCSGS